MRKGNDWETLSADLTNKDKTGDVPFNTITTIHESPMHFGWIYCGTDDGNVWKSRDAGYTWTNISAGLPKGLYVSRVTASIFKENRLYVSMNGYRNDHFNPYIFISENGGETWTEIGSALPYEPVNVIREDSENENLIFAGTDNGLYASLNKGKTWMAMNGEVPRVAVHDLVVQPREGELVLGTHGRSIFIASLKEVRLLSDSVLNKSLFVFSIEDASFNKRWGKKSNSFSDPLTPSFVVPYFTNADQMISITIKTEKGLVVKTMNDTAEAGINYLKYDLSIDSNLTAKLMKSKLALTKADDGKYYLPVESYTIEFKDKSGATLSKSFKVKDKDSKEKEASTSLMGEKD